MKRETEEKIQMIDKEIQELESEQSQHDCKPPIVGIEANNPAEIEKRTDEIRKKTTSYRSDEMKVRSETMPERSPVVDDGMKASSRGISSSNMKGVKEGSISKKNQDDKSENKNSEIILERDVLDVELRECFPLVKRWIEKQMKIRIVNLP